MKYIFLGKAKKITNKYWEIVTNLAQIKSNIYQINIFNGKPFGIFSKILRICILHILWNNSTLEIKYLKIFFQWKNTCFKRWHLIRVFYNNMKKIKYNY